MAKLCKNCYYRKGWILGLSKCNHPKAVAINLVTGRIDRPFCSTIRITICGPGGVLFESKN